MEMIRFHFGFAMKYLSVSLVVILLSVEASAGISYYSNVTDGTNVGPFNKAGVSLTQGQTSPTTQTWNPLASNDLEAATLGFILQTGGGTVQLQDVSSGNMKGYVSYTSFGNVLGVTDDTTKVFTTNSTHFITTDSPSSNLFERSAEAAAVPTDINYSDPSYFLWSAELSGALYAIGWAKVTKSPASVQGVTGSNITFSIDEWAYNLASSSTSIRVGDTNGGTSTINYLSTGDVPEPAGFAVFAVLCASASFVRKRTI